jgi:hypothetical protein
MTKPLMWLKYSLWKLKDQVIVILPISLLLILNRAVIFEESIHDLGFIILGLLLLTLGLTLFIEGLLYSLMPLGEQSGRHLPTKVNHWILILIIFGLGMLGK